MCKPTCQQARICGIIDWRLDPPEPLASYLVGLPALAATIVRRSAFTDTDFDEDLWFTAPEAVAYGLADGVIGGPAGALESGTPA